MEYAARWSKPRRGQDTYGGKKNLQMKNNSVGVSGIYLSDFCGVNSFRLQRRLSGDKAAAAHGGNGWLAVEFGTPTVAKNVRLLLAPSGA